MRDPGCKLAVCISTFVFCISCRHHAPPELAPAPVPKPDFAVVTWNVHGDAGTLRPLLEDLQSGKLTGGAPPAEYALLLQEASSRHRVEGLHWFFAAARRVRGVERGNAILSSVPFLKTEAIELQRERQRRVAAVANIRIAGVDLMFANVHLENRASWWKGGLPGDTARARQMKDLLEKLPKGPGVLGGDMNVWLGTREDAYAAAATAFPDSPGDQALLSFKDRLALDHLFFRLPPAWKAFRRRAPHRYGSDHYPVVAVLVTR